MSFARQFTGSFYSAALYARLRGSQSGYGLGYALWLYAVIAVLCTLVVLVRMPPSMQSLPVHMLDTPALGWIMVALIGAILRGLMLFFLAVAARLFSLKLRPVVDYKAAFRLAAVAYTPVALIDAVAFCLHGQALNPLLLFVTGCMMLLAALYASR